MFSQDQDAKQVDVVVRVIDGSELQGKLVCGLRGMIEAVLNNEGQFIELRDQDNKVIFIAKRQITSLQPVTNADQVLPKLKSNKLNGGNWEKVLGVGKNANSDQVKEAYHALAKQYHPDHYPSILPIEVRQYAHEMLSRINIAYEQYQYFKLAA